MRLFLFISAVLTLSVSNVHAAISDIADANGYGYFRDDNTGRVWLDMDNFFQQNTDDMVAEANAIGFTLATTADVSELLGSLPLTGGEWSTYKSIMMDAPNRELIWGSFDDNSGDPYGWAYATDFTTAWAILPDQVSGTSVPNDGTEFADMNIWAYSDNFDEDAEVPEPATLTIWGLGALGCAVAAYRRKRLAA